MGIGTVVMDILDTGGQQEYASMKEEWMRDRSFFLMCFTMDSKESLDYCVDEMLSLRTMSDCSSGEVGSIGLMLVACQMDRNRDHEFQRSRERALEMSTEWNIPMVETSAKKNINVNFMFDQIVYEYWLQTTTASIRWDEIKK